ncbi:hypothetical protein [Bacteroides acidifaciens]|jgi:hypothetical protein|nr:hypothetical protein [Bacteroides acidifaciens]
MIEQINELLIAGLNVHVFIRSVIHTYEQQSSNQIKRTDVQTDVAT